MRTLPPDCIVHVLWMLPVESYLPSWVGLRGALPPCIFARVANARKSLRERITSAALASEYDAKRTSSQARRIAMRFLRTCSIDAVEGALGSERTDESNTLMEIVLDHALRNACGKALRAILRTHPLTMPRTIIKSSLARARALATRLNKYERDTTTPSIVWMCEDLFAYYERARIHPYKLDNALHWHSVTSSRTIRDVILWTLARTQYRYVAVHPQRHAFYPTALFGLRQIRQHARQNAVLYAWYEAEWHGAMKQFGPELNCYRELLTDALREMRCGIVHCTHAMDATNPETQRLNAALVVVRYTTHATRVQRTCARSCRRAVLLCVLRGDGDGARDVLRMGIRVVHAVVPYRQLVAYATVLVAIACRAQSDIAQRARAARGIARALKGVGRSDRVRVRAKARDV